jgi:hypothetical protein
MKVALLVCLVIAAQLVTAVNLRSRRAALVPAAIGELKNGVSEDGNEMVMAEMTSEADSITEDGSNDESAAIDERTAAPAESESTEEEVEEEEPIHTHFRRFTKPMELLPNDHTTLIEVAGNEDGEEGGADKGSNPTYILPVDPFNYFPFFNGFSNVNPFSQFYPPPPYLYPQYTNYMHNYANHGVGHPPAYPYPGQYHGGAGGAYGHGAYNFGGVLGGPHAGFPYNAGHPHPHMHYPFGAYKMDVSGPDVRTGSNNPPPFPQFIESSSLIKPELIPINKDVTEDEYIAAVEVAARAAGEVEDEDEVEFEDEAEADESAEDSTEVEFADSEESESGASAEVEIVDSDAASDEGAAEMTSTNVEFADAEADHAMSSEVEYV